MERKYTKALLVAMRQKQYTVTEQGLPILVKPIPEEDRPGVLDPRTSAQMAPMFKGIKGFVAKQMIKRMAGKGINAQQMRGMFDAVKSIPITEGVQEQRTVVTCEGTEVPVRIYTPLQKKNGLQPVFYYIHGGGFAAGRPEVVEEMCKLVVQNTGCVAIQPQYRLAPEHPYPAGLDDCYAVLQWIAQNAQTFGGDAQRICISGDSAGGNFATVCAMRDRDDGAHLVKVQALIYPTVNMAGVEDENYHFSLDQYQIDPGEAPVIEGLLNMMGNMNKGALGALLGVQDETAPTLSPYLGNLAGMPPCIILYGEFDYLRLEDEAYARKLQKAGVEVKAVRYKGLSHGFADPIGVQPQAEDCMMEIGDFMMQHLARGQIKLL